MDSKGLLQKSSADVNCPQNQRDGCPHDFTCLSKGNEVTGLQSKGDLLYLSYVSPKLQIHSRWLATPGFCMALSVKTKPITRIKA